MGKIHYKNQSFLKKINIKIKLAKINLKDFFYLVKTHFFWSSIYESQEKTTDLISNGYKVIPNFISELDSENLSNIIKSFEKKST